MNRIAWMIGIALLAFPSALLAQESGCLTCHTNPEMKKEATEPVKLFLEGVHAKAGLNCTACHGGPADTTDFLEAHSRKNGFRSRPKPTEIPALCGSCHDDAAKMKSLGARPDLPTGQGKHFAESVHGGIRPVKDYEEPSCISCHGVHGIRAPSDPQSPVNPRNVPETCNRCHGDFGYMRAFTSARVRIDQLEEYKTSVHGQRLAEGDTKVAVCSSCHGAHDILPASNPNSHVYAKNVAETCGRCHADPERMAGYEIAAPGGGARPLPTTQLERYRKSVHHEMLMEKGDLSAPTCNDCHGNHGATPPEIRIVANVCAQCHSRPAELFGPSPVSTEITDAGYPGCATCHGHHEVTRPSDELLARVAAGETPAGWQPGAELRATAAGFLDSIHRLSSEIDRVDAEVARAENFGMDTTRARLKLNQAEDRLTQARVTIHAWDPAQMAAVVEGSEEEAGGLQEVARAEELAEAAMQERTFRRQGLVVALLVILLVIVALVLKIRRLEAVERQREAVG